MMRMLDLVCSRCGAEVNDLFMRRVPARIVHLEDDGEFEQVYRPSRKDAQWSERDAVVVFRKPDGTISYPAKNTKVTPPNCERIELRSMAAVRQFEKEHGVISHIAHFDNGSGRAIDDAEPSMLRGLPSERERYERFRKYTQGIF